MYIPIPALSVANALQEAETKSHEIQVDQRGYDSRAVERRQRDHELALVLRLTLQARHGGRVVDVVPVRMLPRRIRP